MRFWTLSSSFNPRPPRGGRLEPCGAACPSTVFQSTPPAWGATPLELLRPDAALVSIHAPRVGGDARGYAWTWLVSMFQSTPPAWGATGLRLCLSARLGVSIHAP